MEATSERSFMSAVNERECARSSERRAGMVRARGRGSSGLPAAHNMFAVPLSTPETFVAPQKLTHPVTHRSFIDV